MLKTIYQSVQRDRWELPGGAGNYQWSHYTDWYIQINSKYALHSFDLVSCTDRVEKALLFFSGLCFLGNFQKTRLKFGESIRPPLIH